MHIGLDSVQNAVVTDCFSAETSGAKPAIQPPLVSHTSEMQGAQLPPRQSVSVSWPSRIPFWQLGKPPQVPPG